MAKQRNFKDADRLHELFMEFFPIALSDIIKTAETIEHEKTAAIDKKSVAVWSSLQKVIGINEFVYLYHLMEHRSFNKGEMVITQGKQNSNLFFINNGRVEVFFQGKRRGIPVKTMGAGEILGANTFFEASVCTVNGQSLGAEISSLTIEKMQECKKHFPGLEAKLHDFSRRFRIRQDSFGKAGSCRRMFERLRISGIVKMHVFDKEGKDSGIVAKGELFDISVGGISFYLRISRKSNARMLLGKAVGLTIESAPGSRFNITGTVKAARSQPIVGNEYAVSVSFSRLLVQKELKDLVSSSHLNSTLE